MTTNNSSHDGPTLIDALLADQRELSAADRFARQHENHAFPAQAKYYRDLIPLTLPKPGEQYAFEVDLDRCSGCKACVTACHSLNGLDEEETWRDVGLLRSEDWRAPFQATVTTACHHCVDPGCLSGCPVLAYDKDPVTGIVRHLDDQCIGCQYCIMKCPYEVPKYSAKRGIVRKCDMCSSRLSHGEAPACVQACPSQAIRITFVEQKAILNQFRGNIASTSVATNNFLPTAPEPSDTLPTTLYKSSRPLPRNLLAGDHARVSPAPAHLPLVFMLVLSQLAVGLSIGTLLMQPAKWFSLTAALAGMLALGLGSLHLGRPLKAWRAFLGWRTSWFSREIIAFGIFVPSAMATLVAFWFPSLATLQRGFAFATAGTGLLGIACSAMIYVDTRREFWNASQSFTRFLGTTFLLGSMASAVGAMLFPKNSGPFLPAALITLCALTIVKLVFEHRIFNHLVDEESPFLSPLNKTARLLAGKLGLIARLRFCCGFIGGIILPVTYLLESSVHINSNGFWLLTISLFCITGELLERHLFFTAVAPAKMPGSISA
ncbi:DmsC/YnfH family molybdoenzyme membrane anchor subunit [Pedosphaera parvula]|uniref:4Fe-4S ferredoxin iron-sulfur binding domain protein n=1 Tax=Pedosphaera parvula (strain Ellin514) TaxID=320771 RepID=B9XJ68_PEDPL|nr:DmsC/YnfH family molybdoenzyme membrane anchor subunit [Pedosphaera parvula]EEF60106.1 4Fe-4S ferredoxin iron-sulfur binding domain protein [Pedosphaera parvula Ellin514]